MGRRSHRRHAFRSAQVTTSVTFELDIVTATEGDQYLIEARPVRVATFGSTPSEAVAALVDAIDSYLKSLMEHNELLTEFDRLGVPYQIERVVAAASPARIELPVDPFRTNGPARGHALVPC